MTVRLFLIIMLCVLACSEPTIPKDILPPEKMQAVYWDYIKADVFVNEFVRRDTTKNPELESAKLQAQVFQLHKVSRNEFYKSYDFYLKNRELMKDMLDTMLVRQTVKLDTSAASSRGLRNKRDSNRFLPFSLTADTSAKKAE